MPKPKVAIIMGSDSDLPVMKQAVSLLKKFEISFDLKVLSAHRTPKETVRFAKKACEQEIKVIIAGAGGAAHLPGVIASYFPGPVIGVPIKTPPLAGIDSLYSIVQMPAGVPVATVGINAAQNAALLAIEILAISEEALQKRLVKYRDNLAKTVLSRAKPLI